MLGVESGRSESMQTDAGAIGVSGVEGPGLTGGTEYGVGLGRSVLSSLLWAEQTFGKAQLGDARRTRRLVDIAAAQAERPGVSLSGLTKGDGSRQEAFYRFVRNDKVSSQAITRAGSDATLEGCAKEPLVLAIQDSTELSFPHASVRENLGQVGNGKSKVARGFVVHTTLAVAGIGGSPIGIMDQVRWKRQEGAPGKAERKTRPYKEKESFKWQAACERVQAECEDCKNVIVVGDRETDIYELLAFCRRTHLRFVFRGTQNRLLMDGRERLLARMASRPVMGTRDVHIEQRGAQTGGNGQHPRPARPRSTVTVVYRTCRVQLTIASPDNEQTPKTVEVGVVLVSEVGSDPTKPKEGLHWLLLTSEDVDSQEAAERVIEIYETRWVIEEYHKAYKSGCKVEEARMQEADNLERFASILAFVALRVTQIAVLARIKPVTPVEVVLEPDELLCLTRSLSSNIRYHNPGGTVGWALEAIGRLGGWTDTKRIGHPGWDALLKGWMLLQARVEGFRMAMALWEGKEM